MERSEIIEHLVNLLNDRMTVTPTSVYFNQQPLDTTLMYIHLRENDSIKKSYVYAEYKSLMDNVKKIQSLAEDPDELAESLKFGKFSHMLSNGNRYISSLNNLKHKYDPKNIVLSINLELKEWMDIANDSRIGISDMCNSINKMNQKLLKFNGFNDLSADVEHFFNSIAESRAQVTYLLRQLEETHPNNIGNKEQIDKKIKETAILLANTIKNPERALNQPYNLELADIFNHHGYKETLTNINKQFNKIYQKIMDSRKCMPFSEAEGYLRTVLKPDGKKSATDFIIHKNVEDAIEFQVDISVPSKIKTFISFNDNSILIKDNQDNYIMLKDNNEAIKYVRELFNTFIDEKLGRKPFVAKYFKKILSLNYSAMEEADLSMNTYLDNEDILKNLKFNVSEMNFTTFEEIDDHMNSMINDYKVKKYAHSITSNKYNHLFNVQSYEIIKEIYDLKIESNVLQTMIGKKLAAFKNPQELNSALNTLLDGFNSFTIDQMTTKALNNKANIIHSEDNIIILEINNFEQSKLLGSSSWCISRDKAYFKSYTAENCKQYFVYDFNKNSKDNKSMIGITLNEDGSYYAAHVKDDTSISIDNIKHLQLKIISKSIESYPLLDESLKKEIALNENNKSIKKRLDI